MPRWKIEREDINDDYVWGEFGGFRVIISKEDGYINATRIVSEEDKKLDEWLAEDQTKEYLLVVARETGVSVRNLTRKVGREVSPDLRGTYIHPDLIIQLAMWCSPRYAHEIMGNITQQLGKK